MAKYYGLIAGLPELSLDAAKLPLSLAELRAEMLPQLSARDKRLLELLELEQLHSSVLALAQGQELELPEGEEEGDPILQGYLRQLPSVCRAIAEGEPLPKHSLPSYVVTFLDERIQRIGDAEGEATAQDDADELQAKVRPLADMDRLTALYYAYAMERGGAFLGRWFRLNQTLRNVLVVYTCRALGWDASSYVVGDTYVEEQILTSKARDYGLGEDIPEMSRILQIAEEGDITRRERMIDALRWEWLEEETFARVFDFDSLLTYYLRLQILERWAGLNAQAGEASFRQIVHGLKGESKRSLEVFRQQTQRR